MKTIKIKDYLDEPTKEEKVYRVFSRTRNFLSGEIERMIDKIDRTIQEQAHLGKQDLKDIKGMLRILKGMLDG